VVVDKVIVRSGLEKLSRVGQEAKKEEEEVLCRRDNDVNESEMVEDWDKDEKEVVAVVGSDHPCCCCCLKKRKASPLLDTTT
jgi:hypothetical protein